MFPPVSDDFELPPPEPGKQYLLYLHVPYCAVLCPFCSFHRVLFKRENATRYFDCLQREIRLLSGEGYRFSSAYIGGGTPTVLPDQLAATLELLRNTHELDSISVETNPDDLEVGSMHLLQQCGVNRLSVGVQSFDDDLLHQMQRYETYGSGNKSIERIKRAAGVFDTLNIDMIFNFPRQSEASLRRDLEILTNEICVDQVSWYPLMSAKSTLRPMQHHLGGGVDHSREKYYYQIIAEHMLLAGYSRSSAWCFSRKPGLLDEYIVEHEEYVGLGSGSFSYLQGQMFASTFSINHYIRLVESGAPGTVRSRDMSERDQMRYYLLMQLFSGTLDLDRAEQRFDLRFRRVLFPELTALRAIGALTRMGSELRLTERGYYLWVQMMREFFTGVSDLRDEMRHHIAAERVN